MSSQPSPSWAEARDGALERLVAQVGLREFYGFREQLLEACADVLAESEGKALVFLGRSPENLYDLLRALLRQTWRAPRLLLLPFSFRDGCAGTASRMARLGDEALEGLERHLHEAGLDPQQIAEHPCGVAFVDCVGWGTTFGNLDETFEVLTKRREIRARTVSSKIRYVGLAKASLGWTHWRNDEESRGARFFAQGRAGVVSISSQLWRHLADRSPKTTDSYTLGQWGEPPRLPVLDEGRAQAIRLATELLAFGSARDVRRAFAAKLGRRASDDRPWLRSLVVSLLRSTQPRKRRPSAR